MSHDYQYQYQVSQPIIFKRGTSLVAPVLLWLMDALPAVLAGVMFYPLCRLYDVDYDKPFVVLSILAAMATLAVLPPHNQSTQIVSSASRARRPTCCCAGPCWSPCCSRSATSPSIRRRIRAA